MEGVVPKYSTKLQVLARLDVAGHTTSFGVVKYFRVYYAEIINAIALGWNFRLSLAVVGATGYVYLNEEASKKLRKKG